MALYRGCTKVSGIGQSFNPENTGTEGQVLTKTNSGYAYCDPQGGGGGQYVDVLLLGGGGAGGAGYGTNGYGGGGGAGELKELYTYNVLSSETCVVVGAGGENNLGAGCNGCPTKFGIITAEGGGGGGAGHGYATQMDGKDGASGGGAGARNALGSNKGGNASHGHIGARANCQANYLSGGGGGVLSGYNGMGTSSWSAGGIGVISNFGGVKKCIGGGGNGGTNTTSGCYMVGTYYGGGLPGCNGTANSGAGGGGGVCGGTATRGGCGGSGLVIVRYPTDGSYGITSSTGGDTCRTCTIDGTEYCIHEFTSDGTFCITG